MRSIDFVANIYTLFAFFTCYTYFTIAEVNALIHYFWLICFINIIIFLHTYVSQNDRLKVIYDLFLSNSLENEWCL